MEYPGSSWTGTGSSEACRFESAIRVGEPSATSAQAHPGAGRSRSWPIRRWPAPGLIALGLTVALASCGSQATSASAKQTGTTTHASASTSTKPPVATTVKPSHPGIGQVAKDGDFSFVVESFTCGAAPAKAVDPDGIGEKVPAGSQECLATIKVTNDKKSSQTFFASNQYAYDAQNRQFSADETGALYISNSNSVAQVNPGVTIVALVPFQIPASDKIVRLELHDSAFSGGVQVDI
jgi:hypothetical protein